MDVTITLPYKATLTSTVTFRDIHNNLVDPATVEVTIKPGHSYTYANNDITRISEGVYELVWLADTAGFFKRVWVGETVDGEDPFYAESKIKNIRVTPSHLSQI